MGQHLVDILNKFQEMTQSQTVWGAISDIQAQQIDGMFYCAGKKVVNCQFWRLVYEQRI